MTGPGNAAFDLGGTDWATDQAAPEETVIDHMPWHVDLSGPTVPCTTAPCTTAPVAMIPSPTKEESIDLEIGEASRVVSFQDVLQPLATPGRPTPLDPNDFGPPLRHRTRMGSNAPGFSRDAVLADFCEVFIEAEDKEARPRSSRKLFVALGIATSVAVAGIAYIARPAPKAKVPTRMNLGADTNVALSISPDIVVTRREQPVSVAAPEATEADKEEGRSSKRRRKRSRRRAEEKRLAKAAVASEERGERGLEEVDLSAPASAPRDEPPLTGDDLMAQYRSHELVMRMCYEKFLKKDPSLRVPASPVAIEINGEGKVVDVKMPALEGTLLGTCVKASMTQWKFRATGESFSGRFTVAFAQ